MHSAWSIYLVLIMALLTGCGSEDSENLSQDSKSSSIDSDQDGIQDDLDCDPNNPLRWKDLPYSFQDLDNDGYYSELDNTAYYCSGSDPLPNSFKLSIDDNTQVDCNDNNPDIFQVLEYNYVDKDRDGVLLALNQSMSICSGSLLKEGLYLATNGLPIGDCDDNPETGLLVYREASLYQDNDQDGIGTGSSQSTCIGENVPPRFSELSGDCNDFNPELFKTLSYRYEDKDLDGHLIDLKSTHNICSGHTLPPQFLNTLTGKSLGDCNDDPRDGARVYKTDLLFEDKDGDGVGSEVSSYQCIGDQLPNNFAKTSNDCDDNDQNSFQILFYNYKDMDGDGYLIQEPKIQTICSGQTLPENRYLSSNGLPVGDCDDQPNTGRDIYRTVDLFRDGDLDTKGAGDPISQCIGDHIPQHYSLTGSDCDDTNQTIYNLLSYQYTDLDEDQYLRVLPTLNTICTGDHLPENLFDSAVGHTIGDCDDDPLTGKLKYRNQLLYTDNDKDGYGSNEGSQHCIGDTYPDGLSVIGTDCDDTNASIYQEVEYRYQDLDKDNVVVELSPTVSHCIGDDPVSDLFESAQGKQLNDCDDNNSNLFQLLPYNYTDLDLDRHLVQLDNIAYACSGESLPNEFHLSSNGLSVGDCDDSPENGNGKYQEVTLYADQDSDGYGFGASNNQCIGSSVPANQSTNNTDCDDTNPLTFKSVSYSYEDKDADTHFVKLETPQEICIGAQHPTNLRQSYEFSEDCDDHPETGSEIYNWYSVYEDHDLDGYGSGDSTKLCLGKTLPAGYSTSPLDCDDQNAAIWKHKTATYQDKDGDHVFSKLDESIEICSGHTIPYPYLDTQPHYVDCNEDDKDLFRRIALFEDKDADGIGNANIAPMAFCIGGYLPENRSQYAGDLDDLDPTITIDIEQEHNELHLILN